MKKKIKMLLLKKALIDLISKVYDLSYKKRNNRSATWFLIY